MEAFTSSSTEIKRCGVCTGFLSGQPFMTSECAHTFHVGCYQHNSNKNQTCPVCNTLWTSANSSTQRLNPNPNPNPSPLGCFPPLPKPLIQSPFSFYRNPRPSPFRPFSSSHSVEQEPPRFSDDEALNYVHLTPGKPKPAVGLIFNCRIVFHHDLHNPYLSCFLHLDKPTTPQQLSECHGAEVLHSCNGLLLCESLFGFQQNFIYNPITKKTSTLQPAASMCAMYLAFDPSESCRHYKIVCVVGLEKDTSWSVPPTYLRFEFEVYSSETGSWTKTGNPFSATVDFKSGVYWKGAIHWVSLTKAGKSIYFNPCACDEDDDRMLPSVMPSPPILGDAWLGRFGGDVGEKKSPWYRGRNYHFGESCGHLNFIDSFCKDFEFNVYEMKTDYSEWYVKYRVDLSNVVVNGSLFSICTLVRGNKDEDTFFVLRIGKKFIRCNLVDKTCETILECEGNTKLEKELLGREGEFPLHYIEGAYGNLDGVWATAQPHRLGGIF